MNYRADVRITVEGYIVVEATDAADARRKIKAMAETEAINVQMAPSSEAIESDFNMPEIDVQAVEEDWDE
jgi:CheY-like chemotaxis protein